MHSGGGAQGALIMRDPQGRGYLINLGDCAEGIVSPRYEETQFNFGNVFDPPRFDGFDIEINTARDATMLWVANFDDLFNRVRSEATVQPDTMLDSPRRELTP